MANLGTDVTIAIVGNGAGVAAAGDRISIISNTGQLITGIVSAVSPVGGALATNPLAILLTINSITVNGVTPGDSLSIAGNAISLAGAVAMVIPGAQPVAGALIIAGRVIAIAGAAVSLNDLINPPNPAPLTPAQEAAADAIIDRLLPDLIPKPSLPSLLPNPGIPTPGVCRPSDAVGTSFDLAQRPPRRDPLMLDLNGDGEISHTGAANSSAYFDHDLDGVRTKTGWVTGGDGLLVLDVNGNGTIDNGSELFGDHFTKTRATAAGAAGQFARDGFDALASLDTNADGYVDAADAQFAQLKVWVDANGDGISQAGELRSLAAATTNAAGTPVGITRFNVTPSAVTTTNTANGNQTAAQGSFETTAGTNVTLDSVTMQDVNLGQDTFHSQFINAIPITTAAAQLAFMNGSGLVRNTQEAASLAANHGCYRLMA